MILGILYSNDLTQKNSEYLFQTSSDASKYLQFKKRFSDEQQIVVTITGRAIKEAAYLHYMQKIDHFKLKWKGFGIEVVDFFNIYKLGIKSERFDDIEIFASSHPELMFNFLKKNRITFLVIITRELSPRNLEILISDLKSMDANVSLAGLPVTNQLLNQYSQDIKIRIFPIMLLLAFVITIIITRSFTATLLNLYPSVMALFLTLSTIKFFFKNMNMITVIAPLLIFTLSLSISFHLYYSIRVFENFKKLFQYKFKPIFLMVTTTSIGFGSLYVSEIESIRQFALLTSVLIFLTAGLILGWYKIMFDMVKRASQRTWTINFSYEFLSKPSKLIGYGSMVLLIGGGWFASRDIELLTDATKYLPVNSFERKSIDYITRYVWGNPNYEVLIHKSDDSEFDLEFEDYKNLGQLEQEIQNYFKKARLLSVNQLVSELNYLYTGKKQIPLIPVAYFTMLGQVPEHQKIKHLKDGYYRITIFGSHIGHEEFKNHRSFFTGLSKRYPDYQITLNGLQYSMLKSQEYLITTLIKSFMVSFVIIVILFALLFRQIRSLIPFVVVNLIPLISSLIFIRLMNYSLNIATVMTFSISLGLIVDSTIHVIYDKMKNISQIEHVQTTLNPIIVGQMILILSFCVFGANSFLPIRQTGGILAYTLMVALIFDIYHLPLMINKKDETVG
ncbi:MAG: hypothetical protein A2381_16020 [Bdellovibrionales bacterium RIFOXYB1_FULL_37_110]|nr:MAG: hypothetical protein A2417_07870 [Bdellovibrionales bacterium RIFOXYC1_FULL_37_79]OFZ57120.1 MAG: hypothetical protein A2381_16020 [Bdellovibrionales bacterium RIFOXYB1_FULL_37_110]OFZ65396.1 MAG: hypothetical protein A2577_03850 [Bdellovibrionales bacterium RIFOXYD1_FULL_36_51]